jgi:hypothetical protein
MRIIRCILILIILLAAFVKKVPIVFWVIPVFVLGSYLLEYVQHKKQNKTKRKHL